MEGQLERFKPKPCALTAVLFDARQVVVCHGQHGGDIKTLSAGARSQLFGKKTFAAAVWARDQNQAAHDLAPARDSELVAPPDLIEIAVVNAGLLKGRHVVDNGAGSFQHLKGQRAAAAFAKPHAQQQHGL